MTASNHPAADEVSPVNEGVAIGSSTVGVVDQDQPIAPTKAKKTPRKRMSPALHALIWVLLGILLAAAIIFAWPLIEILRTESQAG